MLRLSVARYSGVLQQKRPELVVPVVGCCEQRRPAILRDLVHVGSRLDEIVHGLDVVFASRKNHRGQTTTAGADEACDDDVRLVCVLERGSVFSLRGVWRRRGGGRRR